MEYLNQISLEKALAKTESDADSTLKAANAVVSLLKKLRVSAKVGNLRELKRAIDLSEQAIATLKQQFSNTKDGWNFKAENYIGSRAYLEEIVEIAKSLGVKIFEQDEKIYCYPFIIRIVPNEIAVQIDKAKEKRLRPSVLVSHLKELQNRPVRFKPGVFIESMFSAYKILVSCRAKDRVDKGIVIPLTEIHKLLTLLPGQSKDYSRQEFGRDVYLLDQSGVTITRDGFVISFPASTGTKSRSRTVHVVTQVGKDKIYFGIAFSKSY